MDHRRRRQAAARVDPVQGARVAILAVQNAIRAARTPPAAAQDDAPAATASAAARTEDHHDQASDPPHVVDHPGRDAVLTPAQRAAAVQVHPQAAMPEELNGSPPSPARPMPGRRAFEARPKPEQPADVVKPADQQDTDTSDQGGHRGGRARRGLIPNAERDFPNRGSPASFKEMVTLSGMARRTRARSAMSTWEGLPPSCGRCPWSRTPRLRELRTAFRQ